MRIFKPVVRDPLPAGTFRHPAYNVGFAVPAAAHGNLKNGDSNTQDQFFRIGAAVTSFGTRFANRSAYPVLRPSGSRHRH